MSVLEIFSDQGLPLPAFLKCNRRILLKNQKKFNKKLTVPQNLEIFWKKELKINLEPKYPNDWEKMVFLDDKEKSIFLLTWS